jgi:Secretion system C-terminal sorting domain
MKLLYAIIAFCLLISYTTFSQSISSNAPLCGNANLTLELTATGGTTYAWKGPNNFTSTQQKPSIKNVNYRNRGVYTVTIDNKTTLTADVNIKDPVAFTVPKEISVCEGGTLIIEPKSGRLTDSTEVTSYYEFINPNGNIKRDYYLTLKNFSNSNVGNYKIVGIETQTGCSTTQIVKVNISNKVNCKIIQIEDLSKVKVCYEQEVSIPFITTGDFKQGTKFSIYILNYDESLNSSMKPDAIVEKSPIVFSKIPYKFWDGRFKIVIVADDVEKTTTTSEWRNYLNSFSQISVNTSASCDSSKLQISNFSYLKDFVSSFQWFLNGKSIANAQSSEFTAKSSGNYTLKFKSSGFQQYEIDKTCLYESQPVKIELGKIEKPTAYVSNDIELCVGKPATLNVSSKANTNYRWKKDGNYIANATNTSYQTLQEGKYQIEAKEGTCTAVSDTVVLKRPDKLENIFVGLTTNGLAQFDQLKKGTVALCDNQAYSLSYNFNRKNLPIGTRLQWLKNYKDLVDTTSKLNNLQGENTYFLKANYGQCQGISNIISIKYVKAMKGVPYNSINGNSTYLETCKSVDNLHFRLDQINYAKLQSGKVYKDNEIIGDWSVDQYGYYNYISTNESGKYYAIGKIINANDNTECAVFSDTLTIKFVNKINSSPQTISQLSCKDTTNITPYYNPLSGRESAYKWTKDGITLKQDPSSTFQVTQAGIYQLETTYKGGCTFISSPYKVEFGKLNLTLESFGEPSICNGQSFYLYPKILEPSDKNIYDLYKDGQIFNPNIPLQYSFPITQPGTYKLKVTNGKCEGTSPDFTLKVDKIPTSITPSDSVTFCAGKTVELKASTEAGLSYIWERNGSVISQANQANYTANADGLYKATLLRGACWGITPSVKLKSLANIIPTATLTGDKKIDYDTETKLFINLTSHAPWTFKLSDGKEYTATKSPFEISVKPLYTTTYSVTEVKNICGTGTVSGSAKIEIIILWAEEEKELKVEVFPMPSSEICHWKIETPQATNASVLMYDVLGVTQFSQSSSTRTQTHEGTIDLTNIKAGTYFLKLQAGEKSVVRKVVKF